MFRTELHPAVRFYDTIDQFPDSSTKEIIFDEKDRLIESSGSYINLEITDSCYLNCEYCYEAGRATPKGEHVPLFKIKERVLWIKRFCNIKEISVIGAESLTHPFFKEIIDFILANGFEVSVITAGVINKRNSYEIANLEYVYRLYEEGDLEVQLSYHPDKNEKVFKDFYQKIKSLAPNRQSNLKKKKEKFEKEGLKDRVDRIEAIIQASQLFSNVTLGESISLNPDRLKEIFKFIFEDCDERKIENTTVTESDGSVVPLTKRIDTAIEKLKKHFSQFGQSAPYIDSYIITWYEGIKYNVRFWGAVYVDRKNDAAGNSFTTIRRPMGNEAQAMACPATQSTINKKDKSFVLDGIMVKTNGELVPTQPGCIEMSHGYANVDRDVDRDTVYKSVASRLKQIDTLIHRIDNHQESERPVADHGCVSCPFDVACQICHRMGGQKPTK